MPSVGKGFGSGDGVVEELGASTTRMLRRIQGKRDALLSRWLWLPKLMEIR